MYPIKLYLKNIPNIIMLLVSFLLNIFIWFWLLWQIKPQSDMMFLHYNILFGVDYTGEWWKVLYLPACGLFILLVNVILGWILFQNDKFASQFLNAIGLFCQVFLLVGASLLVFLNI